MAGGYHFKIISVVSGLTVCTMVVELIVIAALALIAALTVVGFLLRRRYSGIPEEGVRDVDEVINSAEVSEASNDAGSVEVAEGASKGEAAEEAKSSSGKVRSSARKKSSRSRKRRSISRSLERKILTMYKAGRRPKEIAEALGISTSSVYRRVRNALKS